MLSIIVILAALTLVFGLSHLFTRFICKKINRRIPRALQTIATVVIAVLLASYPTEQIDDKVDVLSIYGSKDKVLDRNAYEKAKAYLPDDMTEVVIEGGNHAYFGNYGEQSSDGEAKISPEQQQTKTVYAILKLKK